jgi:hypothetical protein
MVVNVLIGQYRFKFNSQAVFLFITHDNDYWIQYAYEVCISI